VADALLLDSATTDPPVGAGPFNVTVPVEATPPMTEAGFRLNEVNVGGLTVSVAVLDAVPRLAVIVAAAWADTAEVAAVNVALVCPVATVTELGTVAAALLLERDTTVPDEPAGPVRVTDPIEEVPPVTDAGFIVKELRVAAVTVSEAASVTPPAAAAIVAVVGALTPTVLTVNVTAV